MGIELRLKAVRLKLEESFTENVKNLPVSGAHGARWGKNVVLNSRNRDLIVRFFGSYDSKCSYHVILKCDVMQFGG